MGEQLIANLDNKQLTTNNKQRPDREQLSTSILLFYNPVASIVV
tara:strand:- start:31 stop:162 length:132 start_codon:yes stop_codon:yes gene_type:complete